MSNMSYCRFQNTLSDLRDCLEALEDVNGQLHGIESRDERAAALELVEVCRAITHLVD